MSATRLYPGKRTWFIHRCESCEALAIVDDGVKGVQCMCGEVMMTAVEHAREGMRIGIGPEIEGLLDGREEAPNDKRPRAVVTLVAEGGVIALSRAELQQLAGWAVQQAITNGPDGDVVDLGAMRRTVLAPVVEALAALRSAMTTVESIVSRVR